MRYIKYFNELNEAIINANNYSEKDEPENYNDEDSAFQRRMRLKELGKKMRKADISPSYDIDKKSVNLNPYSPIRYTDVPLDVYLQRKASGVENKPSNMKRGITQRDIKLDDDRIMIEFIRDISNNHSLEWFMDNYPDEYKWYKNNFRFRSELSDIKKSFDKRDEEDYNTNLKRITKNIKSFDNYNNYIWYYPLDVKWLKKNNMLHLLSSLHKYSPYYYIGGQTVTKFTQQEIDKVKKLGFELDKNKLIKLDTQASKRKYFFIIKYYLDRNKDATFFVLKHGNWISPKYKTIDELIGETPFMRDALLLRNNN